MRREYTSMPRKRWTKFWQLTMLVDDSDSLQLGRSSFLQSHSNYNRNQGISDAIQKRNEKKTSEITTFHAPGDSIAYLRKFSGAGGHFPCLRGYHWTKRSWDRREVGGIERGELSAVVVCGTVRMAGYVFQGRLDVKMWSWLKCVYVHSFCMYPCMWYNVIALSLST